VRAKELTFERDRGGRAVGRIPGVAKRQPDADVEEFPNGLLRMLDGDGGVGVDGAVRDLADEVKLADDCLAREPLERRFRHQAVEIALVRQRQ
jgi:hypothetical protein